MIDLLVPLIWMTGFAAAGWLMHWFYHHSKFHNDANTGQWDKISERKPE